MEFTRETLADNEEVEYLFDLCFAPGRHNLSSYQLRAGQDPINEVSLLCRNELGGIIGAIRYWPVLAAGAPCLLLGPVAVHPTAQGMGIAAILIRRTLQSARKLGWNCVLLIGDEPYYSRFGFKRENTLGLEFPPPSNPARFLGLELEKGALQKLQGKVTPFTNP